MDVELIDVTESARGLPQHVPGWRVALTQGAWDVGVGPNGDDPDWGDESVLNTLLRSLWQTLRNVPHHQFGFVAGFGFETERILSDYSELSTHKPDWIHELRIVLPVFACIDESGAPQLVVLSPSELPRRPLPN